MSAADEAFVSTVAAAVAAVAGMVAVVVSAVSLVYARRTLKESRATIHELEKIREEGRGTIGELQKLREAAEAETSAERSTTLALHLILSESQATRDFELLRVVARQIPEIATEARRVEQAGMTAIWHPFNEAQGLLAALLAGLPAEALPRCNELAKADARRIQVPVDQASAEIRAAIERARMRLADVTAAADAQLKQLTQAR